MTALEYIEIRICELTARQRKAKQYVMNRDLNREVELLQAQLDELHLQRELFENNAGKPRRNTLVEDAIRLTSQGQDNDG